MDDLDEQGGRLERAAAAMRRQPKLGEFPADRILGRIAASRDAAHRRRTPMRSVVKLAAAIVLAIGAAVVTLTLCMSETNEAL